MVPKQKMKSFETPNHLKLSWSLNWWTSTLNKQVAQIKMRLNCAIGMLSKPQINANFHILKTAYHSLFESHLEYGTQLWGQKNNETITTLKKLQNCALRKITFKRQHNRSCVYKECKILKFPDILNLQNCLFMYQIQHSIAPLFLLFMPKTNTTTEHSRSATHTVF